MSGIFDKYLNMINVGTYRSNGGGTLSGKSNANKNLTQLTGRDVYIPYEKKSRRSSSVGSMDSTTEADINAIREIALDKGIAVGDGNKFLVQPTHEKPVVQRLPEPNNRVNF